MAEIILELPRSVYDGIMSHLLPTGTTEEQAAFVYAEPTLEKGRMILSFIDWAAMKPQDFTHQSEYHLELEDGKRSEIIKRAHDLKASIIEWHSHPMFWPAEFSISDLAGLKEFAPQVMWRLHGRPYGAVVVTRHDFDALVWVERKAEATQSLVVRIGADKLRPTGLTLRKERRRLCTKDMTEISRHSGETVKRSSVSLL